ncbi:MAG: ThuA protein [Frondihabitans sp.]|nr:ThuA protein [Frondihabitans sp.]
MSAPGANEGQPRARIISGNGRYADPWHDFAGTSAALATVIAEAGFEVEVRDDVDDALADLSHVDLVAVNVGRPSTVDEDADARSRAGILAHLERDRPLLGLHVSATSMPGMPEWEDVLGGIWVRGTTMHPEQGTGRVEIVHGAEIGHSLDDFDVNDEFYSYLRVHDDAEVIAQHRFDGATHPLAWSHRYGSARVVYDALGHHPDSFAADGHRRLLTEAVRWLSVPGTL